MSLQYQLQYDFAFQVIQLSSYQARIQHIPMYVQMLCSVNVVLIQLVMEKHDEQQNQ